MQKHIPRAPGRQPAARRRHSSSMLSTACRAVLATELAERNGFTKKLAAHLMGVNRGYVAKVSRMAPVDRARLVRGDISLSSREPVTVERINHFLQRAGADRVLSVIDEMTAPRVAAE